jgi:hypothetical protein
MVREDVEALFHAHELIAREIEQADILQMKIMIIWKRISTAFGKRITESKN